VLFAVANEKFNPRQKSTSLRSQNKKNKINK
jgi:hypothetical protein